jgi:hypothetical protein
MAGQRTVTLMMIMNEHIMRKKNPDRLACGSKPGFETTELDDQEGRSMICFTAGKRSNIEPCKLWIWQSNTGNKWPYEGVRIMKNVGGGFDKDLIGVIGKYAITASIYGLTVEIRTKGS